VPFRSSSSRLSRPIPCTSDEENDPSARVPFSSPVIRPLHNVTRTGPVSPAEPEWMWTSVTLVIAFSVTW
jgi:hypothetical protein